MVDSTDVNNDLNIDYLKYHTAKSCMSLFRGACVCKRWHRGRGSWSRCTVCTRCASRSSCTVPVSVKQAGVRLSTAAANRPGARIAVFLSNSSLLLGVVISTVLQPFIAEDFQSFCVGSGAGLSHFKEGKTQVKWSFKVKHRINTKGRTWVLWHYSWAFSRLGFFTLLLCHGFSFWDWLYIHEHKICLRHYSWSYQGSFSWGHK